MSPKLLIMALTLGAGAVVFSMHGQGGGVLYTPIQVLFGVDFHDAVVRSQWFTIVTSLSAVFVFRKGGKVDWALAFALESASFVGAFISGYFARLFPAEGLTIFLAALVTVAGLLMLRDFKPAPHREKEAPWHWIRECGGTRYRVNLAAGLPLSFLIGITAGLTGAAGGFLKIPMMVALFGMPLDIAFGSSAFMVSLTAAGGFLGHLAAADTGWKELLTLSIFVALGAQIGPRLTMRASLDKARRRFAMYLFVIAAAVVASLWF